MSEMSATCPGVTVMRDYVRIGSWDDYQGDRISVEAYDLDAFIDELIKARDQLRKQGVKTAWSNDADGQGNCGAVFSE